jgi:hypothetical protein
VLVVSIWHFVSTIVFYWILELFRQWGIFGVFHFIDERTPKMTLNHIDVENNILVVLSVCQFIVIEMTVKWKCIIDNHKINYIIDAQVSG